MLEITINILVAAIAIIVTAYITKYYYLKSSNDLKSVIKRISKGIITENGLDLPVAYSGDFDTISPSSVSEVENESHYDIHGKGSISINNEDKSSKNEVKYYDLNNDKIGKQSIKLFIEMILMYEEGEIFLPEIFAAIHAMNGANKILNEAVQRACSRADEIRFNTNPDNFKLDSCLREELTKLRFELQKNYIKE